MDGPSNTCSVQTSSDSESAEPPDAQRPLQVLALVHRLRVQADPVKGRCVLAGMPISAGTIVLKFEGPIFTRDTCPDFSEAIQVGINEWMWSSGGLDDLVNHSCEPNLGLFPMRNAVGEARGTGHDLGGLYLVARKNIAVGEELSFDYSTSMVDEPWDMDCACGETTCRGKIANFLDTPSSVQDGYARAGFLPEHVAAAYLTRGSGKSQGLSALPLDAATSPAAHMFAQSPYAFSDASSNKSVATNSVACSLSSSSITA